MKPSNGASPLTPSACCPRSTKPPPNSDGASTTFSSSPNSQAAGRWMGRLACATTPLILAALIAFLMGQHAGRSPGLTPQPSQLTAIDLVNKPPRTEPARYGSFQIVARYPHDPGAFTQGLAYRDGLLYESTGLWGHSTVRVTDLATGTILRRAPMDDRHFGEGLEHVGDQLVQLTWKSRVALVYDADTLELTGWLPYTDEGWGICQLDSQTLITSNGTSTLTLRDNTLAATASIDVLRDGDPITGLNELECIGDRIWANVYQTDEIVVVEPVTGNVEATFDLRGLLSPQERVDAGVLNGIAYRADTGTTLVTGKNWPAVFELAPTG